VTASIPSACQPKSWEWEKCWLEEMTS
jgi:hypothetical protein